MTYQYITIYVVYSFHIVCSYDFSFVLVITLYLQQAIQSVYGEIPRNFYALTFSKT